MEFACGFVYVPPSVTQKDGQRSNVVKRSALLPPVNRVRPRIPPPPPPTNPAEAKSPKSLQSSPKIIEQLEKSNGVKKAVTSILYENAEFHNKTEAASSLSSQTTPPRKTVETIKGEPSSCSQCGSVLDSIYDNVVDVCYFCQSSELTSSPSLPCELLTGYQDGVFLLNPNEKPPCAADPLLILCIDISGSMSITSQVTMHGYNNFTSHFLSGAELTDSDSLKEAAASFPSPPPLSQTKDYLQRHILGLTESGATALGPAALLAIATASRQPGSKVIICTDGKANTELGNLEVEDNDARTLLSSTIFYQELGEYAANQGVTVSVLSIEGTDCRLDELGRLADRTGGKVVIASPKRLHPEFEQIIENTTIATHCSVTLLLPKSLRMKGEREAGHKGIREVGNVDQDTEITFQFGADEQDAEVSTPASGSRVSIQLQMLYRHRNGQMMLRVMTSDRDVTDDSSAALSSLSLAIIQLNSSQASAALAVRGRFLDARREGELQRKLIERAIEHNRSAEDKETYQEWVKTMEPLYNNIHIFTRRKSVVSDSQVIHVTPLEKTLLSTRILCPFCLPTSAFLLLPPVTNRCRSSAALHHEAQQQEVHLAEE
ncbi:Circularly permutated Ras protein 1 [Nibea albiflora]|uniref:Circularly permutated Ras protein 1 n=1 Tax=Nibea albiflora TaxID=240163 RepID=A0ACB7F4J1_NIBAL|nr:Circularly permutated Ras protein 1 [Nibea albiflora]